MWFNATRIDESSGLCNVELARVATSFPSTECFLKKHNRTCHVLRYPFYKIRQHPRLLQPPMARLRYLRASCGDIFASNRRLVQPQAQ